MNQIEEVPEVQAILASVKERGSKEHDRLRRQFGLIGAKLRQLGDVVVFLDGRVVALDPCSTPSQIIEAAGKKPEKHCVYRVNRCSGAPEPLKDGDRLVDGDELVVTLCKPPQDGGLGRAEALELDRHLLARSASNARVSQLSDGSEALLGEFRLTPGDHATCGVLLGAQYPKAGPDWLLLDAEHEIVGFRGQRRGPYQEGARTLMEYSVHPPEGSTPTAAEHVLAFVAHRLASLRRSAA